MSSDHEIIGQHLTLLQNGTEFFPQLCTDIAAAQHLVHLETYRFAADETGAMVSAALQQAAGRGVTVRILLDGFGSADLSQAWLDTWRKSGIQVQWFRREISPLRLRRYRLRRLHRKLVVIDGVLGYVGGINIVDDIPQEALLTVPRLDYAVRIRGEFVDEIFRAMQHLWNTVAWANFHKRGQQLSVAKAHIHVPELTFLVRDNLRHRRDIERAYLQGIAHAQREVVIANAYFLPGRNFRFILRQAARRGVRVVLLLQGQIEYRLQHYATQFLYDEFLAAGIEIYEYRASYLHAKVAVIDGNWATVGSSNIDPFSLLLAREANLLVRDAGFAAALHERLCTAIRRDAQRIEHMQRTLLSRFLSRISYGIVRFLLAMTGYAKRH